ncbi:hypothetical protein IFM89_005306 [Coptis chinensis]|uniref:Uncharacterized protein n=1 Tax=Coptis chinensis TaxID=261450 RepID=A0A835H8V9_9MAGN|nr:hypothetical protein IFM89_005306 [Coptis chinensis]
MAKLGQQQFVASFNRSSFSSAAAALSLSNNNNNNNTDKEQKMASAEQLVFELSNPDLRENALLDLSKGQQRPLLKLIRGWEFPPMGSCLCPWMETASLSNQIALPGMFPL